MVLTALIRSQVGLAFDTFFALAIILFLRCTVSLIPHLSGIFDYIGRHSGNIFLLHSFIYCYYTSQTYFSRMLLSGSVPEMAACLPLLLALSLICSEVIGRLAALARKL